MILANGHVQSIFGPKENRTRPAINPLFRSAAAAYGPRVTGVILTGLQDDGVAGLAEIKRRGGVAVIQEPSTALFPSMPQSAIEHVDCDYIVPLERVAGVLSNLAGTDRLANVQEESMEKTLLEIKCPECGGPLWEERQGRILEYRCRVGHAYSPAAFREEQQEAVERALGASIITLQDAAQVLERLGGKLGVHSAQEGRDNRDRAETIRKMLPDSKKAEE